MIAELAWFTSRRNQPYSFDFVDTIGEEGHDLLRPLSYPGTHVFVICFSLTDGDSFSHLEQKWIPEIQHYGWGCPMVIVGNKISGFGKRGGNKEPIKIRREEIQSLTNSFRESKRKQFEYVECDVKDNASVERVLDTVRDLIGIQH